MSKALKYAKNGALFTGLINAALNAIKQLSKMDSNPELKFNWKELLLATGKGAIVGGAVGWGVGKITDYQNSKERPINTDAFLYNLALKVRLDKNDKNYILLCQKADILCAILKREFEYELKSDPMRLGSTEKGTALKNKFDIDICLAFKPHSFPSTKEMFESVYLFLKNNVGKYSIYDLRDQKKSIGVIFNITNEKYKIDIVPYKITKRKGNKTTGYLYLNDNSLLGNGSSYTKTDIHALKSLKQSETQKKIVVVLKHWKQSNSLPLSSHLLENLVLDAYLYNQNRIPQKFTKKVIMVLKHIADNLDVAVIRSIENTNNILTNISGENKTIIINACIEAIEEYEYHPNSIIETFQ